MGKSLPVSGEISEKLYTLFQCDRSKDEKKKVVKMRYFTADPHYGHNNAIEYCNRPWKNSDIMDRKLIEIYNSCVNKEDTGYFLGDFSIKRSGYGQYYINILRKLNGRKILILGNHDTLKPSKYVEYGFESVHTSLEIQIGSHNVVLVHDPAASIMDKKKIFLCGHVHTLFKRLKNVINVGVDVRNYTPVSELEIIEIIEKEILK